MAEHLCRQREYGRAVAYCVRADDSKRIARIASQLLDEYLVNGATEFARLVDAIPSSLLHPAASSLRPDLFRIRAAPTAMDEGSEVDDGDGDDAGLLPGPTPSTAFASRLVVLGRLRDYLGYHARGELRSAAVLLVRLLDSGIAPLRLWPALLVDAIPLLEYPGPRPLFDTEETYELLRCLEQVLAPVATAGVDSVGVLRCLTVRGKGDEAERVKAAMAELLSVRQALGRNLARCFAAASGR
jgi:nuclear pore complex protein Nup85